MNNNKGFTLIEIIITMALVIVVIMITSAAFTSILKSTSRLTSSEDSNIEGVVGLEIFRRDLQQAGFGLFDSITNYDPTNAYYIEASVAPANGLNDNTLASQDIPRAIVSFDNMSGASDSGSDTGTTYNILRGSDYLGIKATNLGRSKAAQKWTYVSYTSSSISGKPPFSWPNAADNLISTDKSVVIRRTYAQTGTVMNTLIIPTNRPDIYWPSNPTVELITTLPSFEFNPRNSNEISYIYGVDDGSELGMPFNRADYFVARPSNISKIPSGCAPNTGILYRTNVNHVGGKLTYMPLIDCVADMQVVFGWDINGTGVFDESSAYDSNSAKISVSTSISTSSDAIKNIMTSPLDIRNKLKYIKVYLMVQEGRKDTSFTNSIPINVGDIASLTKTYSVANLTANNWLNYRWKIYRIVVRPKNLTN